jgi:hypothetical protein
MRSLSQSNGIQIQRVIGNIGRAGLSLLVPPPTPRIHEPGIDNWQQINNSLFTGGLDNKNNFPHTSIHLSFTAYELPLQSGEMDEHIIDQLIRILETLA